MKRHAEAVVFACTAASALLISGCGYSKPQVPLSDSVFRVPATRPTMPVQTALQKEIAPALPTTMPISVGASLGQYQTVGGIVSEVNGYPIFANRVLRQLRGELSAKAREMDEAQFRAFAVEEVRKRVQILQRDELIFGAADRNLVGDDRKIAEQMTMQYRTRRITDAGGSVELAKLKAQADGSDFEEEVHDEYRRSMTNVFYRRKVMPRIKISAEDMRAYYNLNLDREFTERDEVEFRLIRVDTRRYADQAAAAEQARVVREKATAADFAEIARTMNDDPRLARAGGAEAPLQRGAYKLEKVEQTLWQTPIGQVTPVIADIGGFYIARIENRKDGRVIPFGDPEVQDRIQKNLWARQFRELTDQVELNLRRNSMVRESPEMVQTAIEMAMQNYPLWARRS